MKHVYYYPSILLLLLLIGCGGDDNPIKGNPIAPQEIIPLAVGNQWWGTIIDFDSTGTATDTASLVYRIIGDTIIVDSITVDTTTGDTTIYSDTWFKWETVINDTMLTDTANSPLFSNRQDGFFGYVVDSNMASLSFKFPAIVGDTFTTSYTLFSVGTYTVISTDTVVTVPNGKYISYMYSQIVSFSNRETREFIAPNIGYVKWELDFTTSGGMTYIRQTYELDSLLLN